jgi:hypothetical protein
MKYSLSWMEKIGSAARESTIGGKKDEESSLSAPSFALSYIE